MVPLYDIPLQLNLNSYEKAPEYVQTNYKHDELYGCCYVDPKDMLTIVIWLDPSEGFTYNTVAHEIFHAVEYVHQIIGYTGVAQSESKAFTTGWIHQEVHKWFKQKKIKLK